MKFAVIGAGVAGSYLGNMLYNNGHDIEIYELQQKEKHWPVCAWGASKHMLEYFSKKANLEFNNYVFHTGKKIKMELPDNKEETLVIDGLVTYDKKQWENDLIKNIDIKYGMLSKKDTFPMEKFDYVVDCTGFHRAFLPKPQNDFIIPAYEYLIENSNEINEFYVIGYKGARGYFWYFPLDKGMAFIGAGDIDRKYYGIKEFFNRYPHVKIVKKIGRPIRLSPPMLMEPFYHDNVIGVGESIGTVFPMLGEGIIPSLLCCEIFLDILEKNPEKFNKEEYRRRVLKKFQYYHDVYKIIRLKMDGKLSTVRHFNLLLSMYKNMKREEKRFGFEVNFDKMRRLVNAL